MTKQVTQGLLTEEQAAQYLNLSLDALRKLRQRGLSPKFIKLFDRMGIRYKMEDLDKWANKK